MTGVGGGGEEEWGGEGGAGVGRGRVQVGGEVKGGLAEDMNGLIIVWGHVLGGHLGLAG